jgi:hypothetical protein
MNAHPPIGRVKAFVLANTMLAIYCLSLVLSIVIAMVIGYHTLNISADQFSYRALKYGGQTLKSD